MKFTTSISALFTMTQLLAFQSLLPRAVQGFAFARSARPSLLKMSTQSVSTTAQVPAPTEPTIRVIPNDRLYVSEPEPQWFGNGPNTPEDPAWSNDNWLKSRFHFSFAEYMNYANTNFGVLRVMNDDLVQPHRGFGAHPHSNVEIITYIVEGELTHQDSNGNRESLGRGSVQFMTAGTQVYHTEHNLGDKPLRFIQTWIVPAARNLEPNYGSYAPTTLDDHKNTLKHIVSDAKDTETSTPVKINQDVNAFAAELELGESVDLELGEDRQAYLLCVEGGIEVNGKTLSKYDASEIYGSEGGKLTIKATDVEDTESGSVAHFLLLTMKKIPGSGREDLE